MQERTVLSLRGEGLAPGAEEGQGSLPRLHTTRPKPYHLGAHLEPTVQDHLHRTASLTVTGEGGTRRPKPGPPWDLGTGADQHPWDRLYRGVPPLWAYGSEEATGLWVVLPMLAVRVTNQLLVD